MGDISIYSKLEEIFADIFMRPVPLTPSLSAKQVEDWDSFRHINLIMAVEERFGVKFKSREIDQLQTVGDLARALQDKVAQGSASA